MTSFQGENSGEKKRQGEKSLNFEGKGKQKIINLKELFLMSVSTV